MVKEFLECGKIVTTHGVKGEVKIEPWADSAEFLKEFKAFYLNNGQTELKVKSSRVHKSALLAVFDGIDDMDKALAMRGKVLFIKRADADLSDGKFFWQDLIGLEVVDENNHSIVYGKLRDISEIPGANDVYYITNEEGKEFLIPGIKDVVKKIDLEENKMYISPLEGLFDDEN